METSVVTSIDGAREASAGFERDWNAFWSGLAWRPIDEYDGEAKPWVIAAAGDKWALAFFSNLPDDPYYTESYTPAEGETIEIEGLGTVALVAEESPFTPGLMWRHAQDCMLWSPLDFLPDRFAEIDEDWQARLAED